MYIFIYFMYICIYMYIIKSISWVIRPGINEYSFVEINMYKLGYITRDKMIISVGIKTKISLLQLWNNFHVVSQINIHCHLYKLSYSNLDFKTIFLNHISAIVHMNAYRLWQHTQNFPIIKTQKLTACRGLE